MALGSLDANGNAATDLTPQITEIIARYFPIGEKPEGHIELTAVPVEGWRGPTEDGDLIRRFLASKPGVGKILPRDLWEANPTELAKYYPAQSDAQGYGASEADAALAAKLTFWTGLDGERIVRLMLQSDLKRPKWDRDGYLDHTVALECARHRGGVLCDPLPDASAEAAAVSGEPVEVSGSVYVDGAGQAKLWRNFAYVADVDKILTGAGRFMSHSSFKSYYGGKKYVVDAEGKATADAFDAFTLGSVVAQVKAETTAFRPDRPEFMPWVQDGETCVNTYRKVEVPQVEGDPTLFLDHLAKLLPNERDRQILLGYLAGVVQYPGVKFQWCPLIQGVDGNGKTLLTKCVTRAVGEKYCNEAKASELSEKFNSWVVGMICISVEDVYTPSDKTEVFETLKPMITNRRQPIRDMGVAMKTRDVCANFILNSNHKDAIRKTKNDRRVCNLYTAQQCEEDLARDGMTEEYFARLYGWLDNENGHAIVSHFLHNYKIPVEFGLASLLSRSPKTTSTDEAVALSLGPIEQEVVEHAEQGAEGFAGGWVSSTALTAMLRGIRSEGKLSHVRRKALLESLGYITHPGLYKGRSTICVDGGRPVLFIKKDHPQTTLVGGAAVIKAYSDAQLPNAPGLVVVPPVPVAARK
jgi:hypothetical protein